MEIIIEKGCGLDVHKGTVVACIMGAGIKKEIRAYTAMTNDLFEIKRMASKQWNNSCGHGESTRVYWKPVFNILEDHFEVILVNARRVKNVPGRKTDV